MIGAAAGVMYPQFGMSPMVAAGVYAAVGDIAGKFYEDNFAS